MQLTSTRQMMDSLLERACLELKKSRKSREQLDVDYTLSHLENSSKLLCPFCKYSSKKNKTSAFIKNDFFKCMACGEARRVR